MVYPTWMWLRQFVGGVMTDFGTWSNTSTAGSWYDLRIECDGANINVWKGPKGGTMSLIKQVSTCTVTTSDSLWFITVDSQWSFDNIRVLSDSLSSSATLAYDNANELTSRTVDGLATAYTYDDSGRMTGKTMGSYTATYGYNYGDKLTSVTSNFPWESAVTYAYGGDGKRRSRTAGGVTAQYKWGAGFDLVNEETSAGALARTYYGRLADVAGTDPATGAYRYYHHDHLGSTRRVTDQSKATLAAYEYTPYGEDLFASGPADVMYRYAMLARDSATGLDFAPFRYYMPGAGRWASRDPLGMVDGPNEYGYGIGAPSMYSDPTGTVVETIWDIGNLSLDVICGNWGDALFDGVAVAIPFLPAGATKLPKFFRPNSFLGRIFHEKGGLVYPAIAFYDEAGEQLLRTDWGPGHWGFGKGSTPHTHLNPNLRPNQGQKTYIGSMWDKLCI
ncbi:MAG: RHS repeat-associated core domain-containing protein [Candidatus Hydrogenedentes bacterium]|nr:RHS repeat-associated core domain-containing protein [Candidatus Hydrogenedentota bacterium]